MQSLIQARKSKAIKVSRDIFDFLKEKYDGIPIVIAIEALENTIHIINNEATLKNN